MLESLEKARARWEKGLTPKAVIEQESCTLVVLQRGEAYHCHRYFQVGDKWAYSIDAQAVPLETVWKWLSNPRAVTKINGITLEQWIREFRSLCPNKPFPEEPTLAVWYNSGHVPEYAANQWKAINKRLQTEAKP